MGMPIKGGCLLTTPNLTRERHTASAEPFLMTFLITPRVPLTWRLLSGYFPDGVHRREKFPTNEEVREEMRKWEKELATPRWECLPISPKNQMASKNTQRRQRHQWDNSNQFTNPKYCKVAPGRSPKVRSKNKKTAVGNNKEVITRLNDAEGDTKWRNTNILRRRSAVPKPAMKKSLYLSEE